MDLSAFKLDGKVALVTGGNSGIGRMIALALSRAGAFVWVVGIDVNDNTKSELEEYGISKVDCLQADVTDYAYLEKIVDKIHAKSGSIDILVNTAGINVRLPAEEMTLDAWDKTIAINLTTPYQLSQLVVPKMQENGWGRIVNIASLQSSRAFANSIPYGASKGGITQLTRALAEAYSKDGILVNSIAPGFFETGLTGPLFEDKSIIEELANKTMMGRNGQTEDLFGVMVFLCSDANSYVTGQNIPLDGGFSSK